jgi:hypothetical protein
MKIKAGNYYKVDCNGLKIVKAIGYWVRHHSIVVEEIFPKPDNIFERQSVLLTAYIKKDLGNNEEIIKVLYGN